MKSLLVAKMLLDDRIANEIELLLAWVSRLTSGSLCDFVDRGFSWKDECFRHSTIGFANRDIE